MNPVRIAINGFGRIGRTLIRTLLNANYRDLEIVAINVGNGPLDVHAHLLRHDSTYGHLDVTLLGNAIDFGRGQVPLLQTMQIEQLDWAKYNVDIVLECTGAFTKREKASAHLTQGARKVMISAPCSDADSTIVYGVNNHALKPEHQVISVGSCTTNCLAPVAQILHTNFGIESGFMTTIHAYTNDQRVLDSIHHDKRRARASAQSLIPASTGAAKSLGLVLPELAGKLDGAAVRVPVPNVSLIDLVVSLGKPATAQSINAAMAEAAATSLKGILDVCAEELVSTDFNRNQYSAVFDSTQTRVVGPKLCRVAAWYDNEWAFACRMLDVAKLWWGLR